MKIRYRHCLAGVLAIALPLLAARAEAVAYRWVDDNGQLQLSDSMPAKAAANGYEVIDPNTGRVIRQVAPRRTAEQKAREEAARRAEEAARRREQAERRHRKVLMALYGSVEDIENARDARLERLDARIKRLEEATERMRRKAADNPDDESYARDLDNLRTSLESARDERRKTRQQYARDIEAFKRLKTGG
jgi:acyl-CoA reductase-like NAD-dependent aldehyde dehydrogenase